MAPLAQKMSIDELCVYDINAAYIDALAEQLQHSSCRVIPCASPTAVVERADRVVTMLPNPSIVRSVYCADNGLLSKAPKGSLFVDCSTVDPATSRTLAALAKERHCDFADAPVSGGIVAAAAGTLVFMVGADSAEVFDRVQALLQPFAKSVVHAGGVGCGSVCKICNNMMLGQHMLAASEAMLLGSRLGVNPKTLSAIISSSSGSCWSNNLYNPFPGVCPNVPASNDYNGGFETRLMLKDLNLAIQAAAEVNVVVNGATAAQKAYSDLAQTEYAHKDFASMLKYLDETSPKKGHE